MRKKKISQKSRRQFKQILSHYYQSEEERKIIDSEIAQGNKKGIELFNKTQVWSWLYSFSAKEIVFLFYWSIGLWDQIVDAIKESSQMETTLKICSDLYEKDFDPETQERIDSFDDEEIGMFLAIVFAMLGNQEGLKMYNQTVSSLLLDAAVSNDALFKAVAVDRSVVAHPTVALRISRAQIMKDEGFMNLLTKSITRTKPRRAPGLDDARFMAEIIDETDGLEKYSNEALADFFMNELEVYPEDRGTSAFKKFLRKRSQVKGN